MPRTNALAVLFGVIDLAARIIRYFCPPRDGIESEPYDQSILI